MGIKTRAEPSTFSIGALSQGTGVNVETIRYYERIGVLPSPPRTEGGHRVYGDRHLRRLNFVRRSRELGFSLDEVKRMLRLVDGGDVTVRASAGDCPGTRSGGSGQDRRPQADGEDTQGHRSPMRGWRDPRLPDHRRVV